MAGMLLVHDGKLRYDGTLTEIFPDFPSYGKPITIRNLLNHTSGLPDYEDLMDAEEKAKGTIWTPEKQIQEAEVLELLKKKKRENSRRRRAGRTASPVMSCSVSSSRKFQEKTYGEFLRARIFAPLKMNPHHRLSKRKKRSRESRGSAIQKKTTRSKKPIRAQLPRRLGDGGIYSNLEDLLPSGTTRCAITLAERKRIS